jgi:hypothetical protein
LGYRSLGIDDYEIRFTSSGSEFYSSGYFTIGPLLRIDPKGKGRLPFEVWRIPADTTEKPERMVIKIIDRNRDTSWSRIDNLYEEFYTFSARIPYPETLPATSTSEIGALDHSRYKLGNFVIQGRNTIETGTVIKSKNMEAPHYK